MKGLRGALGLGALLCLPCLAVLGGGVAAAVVGGTLIGLARNPLVDLAGVFALAIGVVAVARYIAWRRSCAVDVGGRVPRQVDAPARLRR